jgi:hypothetical protein
MTRRVFTPGGGVILLVCAVRLIAAPLDEKPPEKPDGKKHLGIDEIMVQAHLTPENRSTRNNLDNKVLDDKATDDEKKDLLRLYTSLGKQKPPKGGIEEWNKRTDELVASLKAVYAGQKGAKERFKKAADCKACHAVHRGTE